MRDDHPFAVRAQRVPHDVLRRNAVRREPFVDRLAEDDDLSVGGGAPGAAAAGLVGDPPSLFEDRGGETQDSIE